MELSWHAPALWSPFRWPETKWQVCTSAVAVRRNGPWILLLPGPGPPASSPGAWPACAGTHQVEEQLRHDPVAGIAIRVVLIVVEHRTPQVVVHGAVVLMVPPHGVDHEAGLVGLPVPGRGSGLVQTGWQGQPLPHACCIQARSKRVLPG